MAEAIGPGRYRQPNGQVERVLAVVDWPEARGRLVVYASQWVHGWCAGHAGTEELDVNAFLIRESELRRLGWERLPDPPAPPETQAEAAGRRLAELYAAGDVRGLTLAELAEMDALGRQLPDLPPEILRAFGLDAGASDPPAPPEGATGGR